MRQRGGEDKSQRGAAGDGGDGRLELSLAGVDEIFFFNLDLSRRELKKGGWLSLYFFDNKLFLFELSEAVGL